MAKLKIKNRFAVTPNDLLNRDDISLKAKGLYAYFQSKPDNWSFSKKNIASQLQEGISAVKTAIKELKEIGYLETVPRKNKDGTFSGHDYILHDSPRGGKSALREIGASENQPCISKKELSKKESSKKDLATFATANADAEMGKQINKIMEAFQMKLNPTINYGNKTQRKAVEYMLKQLGEEKVLRAIDFCYEIRTDQYAPVITTPYQMKEKWAQIKTYYERQANSPNKIVFIS
jgi:hypothetical protein